uniref:Uncharacterized protein n=1 Tax=Trichogramma kaykai TaxID=54128 RepID=A0ABD2W6M6_9HYME
MIKKVDFLNRDDSYYQDVYDGSIYKEFLQTIPSDEIWITFMWYTDGVRIFKSSKYNIWGFFLIILELPYTERYKVENMILVALWFGEKKPVPNIFLKFLYSTMKELRKGVNIYVEDLKKNVDLHAAIICGTADLPAKALFLGMNQYNGRFGCQVCVQEGRTVDHRRVYPFKSNLNLRTEKDVLESSIQAVACGFPVCGVKGPTILSKICYKFVSSTAVDVMHNTHEGVVKKLIDLWFNSKYSNEIFSISHFTNLVDDKLCSIKPPSFISRRPRTIKDHFPYWKALECKLWLFYYSLPILEDILPSDHFEHYKLLVLAIFLLSQSKISSQDLHNAEILIFEFHSRFERLYGLKYMSSNVHSLRHLPTVVSRLGPLWTSSCFPLEDINGKMKALIRGSKNPEMQLVFNLDIYIKVHTLKNDWLKDNTDAFDFCTKLTHKKKHATVKIEDSIFSVGAMKKLSFDETEQFLNSYNMQGKTIFRFFKMFKEKKMFTSQSIQKKQLNESHYVTLLRDSQICIGSILEYYMIKNCECLHTCACGAINFAKVKVFETTNPIWVNTSECFINYIYECSPKFSTLLVKLTDIKNVCIKMCLNDKMYVAEPVNNLEYE